MKRVEGNRHKGFKRVLVLSDFHCGAITGLTPPQWQIDASGVQGPLGKAHKLAAMQRACWDWYVATLAKHWPFDAIIANGDLIDGAGHRSGGTEQATTDRLNQCEMAEHCLRTAVGAHKTKIYITIGTAYHTGEAEDFEGVIARNVQAEAVGSHDWYDINGVIFDAKHHCGSSSIPHGRHTAVARENLWNALWAERQLQPRADVIIRSHVHYFSCCGGVDWMGFTTPALQSYGTKYGSRRCSGIVDYGMMLFDVADDGTYTWKPLIAKLPALAASAIKI